MEDVLISYSNSSVYLLIHDAWSSVMLRYPDSNSFGMAGEDHPRTQPIIMKLNDAALAAAI